jgi:hypothetical protein
MDFDASRRGGLLIPSNSPFQLVLEPSPDVAMSSVADFATKVSIAGKIDASQTSTITQSLASLGERTEAVMALRESLFRLNLLAADGHIDSNQVTNLFGQILAVAQKIADAELEKQNVKEQQAITAGKTADANRAASEQKTAAIKQGLLDSKLSAIQKLDIAPDKKASLIESLGKEGE